MVSRRAGGRRKAAGLIDRRSVVAVCVHAHAAFMGGWSVVAAEAHRVVSSHHSCSFRRFAGSSIRSSARIVAFRSGVQDAAACSERGWLVGCHLQWAVVGRCAGCRGRTWPRESYIAREIDRSVSDGDGDGDG